MGAAAVQLPLLSVQDLEPRCAPRNPAVLEIPKAIICDYYLSLNDFKIFSVIQPYFANKTLP
jgi:hypothetical protein